MLIYATISITPVIVLAIFQIVYLSVYRRFMRTADPMLLNRTELTGISTPKVALILCVRGFDPTLQQCLDGIFTQIYENYDLHIVVDDPNDEGGMFARKYMAENNRRAVFHQFETGFQFGSLKCRALVHAIQQTIDDYPFIALIDADAAPDEYWLHDLIDPMIQNETIAGTTGNRWFHPPNANMGALVRKIWNAAAVVQMYWYNIPWGGSLAIRREAIIQTRLLDKWATAFVEDTMLHDVFRNNGLTIVRLPHLVLENNENISLTAAYRWMTRQLFNTRHYHRLWWMVLGHAVLVIACLVATIGLGILIALQGQWLFSSVLFGSVLILQIVNFLLIRSVEFENVRILRKRRSHQNLEGTTSFSMTMFAIFLNQLIHPAAALSAQFRRTISWRGVEYRVDQDNAVEIVQYRPYPVTARFSQIKPATKSID